MSDKDFDLYMKQLETEEVHLVLIEATEAANKITLKKNMAIAKQMGHKFHQRLWYEARGNAPKHLTPIPYLVMDVPVRRQSQLLTKKLSVQENTKVIDHLTGQPTGASKSAKISYPEVQILVATGLENSVNELIKFRGGDKKGYLAFTTSLLRNGTVSLKNIEPFSSGVESTKSLKIILTAMHIRNTL